MCCTFYYNSIKTAIVINWDSADVGLGALDMKKALNTREKSTDKSIWLTHVWEYFKINAR